MSIRGYIAGFDLAQMQSLFRSKDEAVVGAAFIRMRGSRQATCKKRHELIAHLGRIGLVVDVCRRAILEGIPLKGVAEEDVEHADAANFLARYGQQWGPTDFADWKVTMTFGPLLSEWGPKLSKRSRTLLSYFDEGRPLFGRRCVPENYYAYLKQGETQTLRSSLGRLCSTNHQLRDDEQLGPFMNALLDAMDRPIDHGPDLWFYAG